MYKKVYIYLYSLNPKKIIERKVYKVHIAFQKLNINKRTGESEREREKKKMRNKNR